MQDTINEQEIKEIYGVTDSFIAKHSRAMGCYFSRRPRQFMRNMVEDFFYQRALDNQRRAGLKAELGAANAERAERLYREVTERRGLKVVRGRKC